MTAPVTLEELKKKVGEPWLRWEGAIEGERVQQYVKATGDSNPRWQGPNAEVPPAFLATLGGGDALAVIMGLKAVILLGTSDLECFRPVRIDDTVTATTSMVSLRERESQAGSTAFITLRTDIANRRCDRVASNTQLILVRSGGLVTKRHGFDDTCGEQEILPLVKQTTMAQMAAWAEASGDNNPIHCDSEYAVSRGLPGVIVPGQLVLAFLGQMITDWLGTKGHLARLSIRYKGMNYPGKVITCRGVVTARGGEDIVLKVWAENSQEEQTVAGTATAHILS